ncbi:MAG: redox-sensing transcriptional repressor Rex [Rubrobacter sp.]|nr:redox-sensing transcriptional repressor Rex [Rubrobacter sp.]
MRSTLQPGLTNRLTKYLRTTQQLIEEGRDAVSSKELGDYTGINPVQVRRDLNAIGFSGTRGVGYQAYDLVESVRAILGLRQTYNIALIGAGNLGSAIASSAILPKRGFVIHDVFDNDPDKAGRMVGNIVVKHVDEMDKSVADADEIIGIIAVPSASAQEVAERMVDAGIQVILNYTDVLLHVPPEVDVHRIDPTAQLMHTLYYLTQVGGEAAS